MITKCLGSVRGSSSIHAQPGPVTPLSSAVLAVVILTHLRLAAIGLS